MKISTAIITIFLILGLLGVPNGVFAQESSPTGSDSTIQCSDSAVLNSMVPLLKGGSRSSSKSSSSKKLKFDGDDDDSADDSTDDGSSGGFSWVTAIIMLVVFLGIVGVLAWFFFLRK